MLPPAADRRAPRYRSPLRGLRRRWVLAAPEAEITTAGPGSNLVERVLAARGLREKKVVERLLYVDPATAERARSWTLRGVTEVALTPPSLLRTG